MRSIPTSDLEKLLSGCSQLEVRSIYFDLFNNSDDMWLFLVVFTFYSLVMLYKFILSSVTVFT